MVFRAVSNGLKALRNKRISSGTAARIGVGAAIGGVVGAALVSKLGSSVSTSDPYKGAAVNFPEDLINNDHWIEFQAKETKGAATDFIGEKVAGLRGTEILGGTIRLPMPSSLSTDYNPTYADESLGPLAGAALKPFDRAMYGNRDLESEAQMGTGQSAIAATIKNTAAGGGVALVQGLFSGLPGSSEAATATALKVFGGIAVNQHKVVLFTGVGFREHTFSWKLSPRNRNESNAIRLICEMFKFYSHPEYLAAGLFFKYPEFFHIKFRHPSYLFELEPSVCTDVRIEYHGQGFPAYIRDANGAGVPAPAEVTLSLSFKETEIITKNTLLRGFKDLPPPSNSTPQGRNQN
jgi:hypothetical protein